MNSIAKRYQNNDQLSINNYHLKGSLWPKNLLNPWLKLVSISVYSWFNLKNKTKPKQSQTKPFFQTPIFDFIEITRIIDKSRQHFLCKTKPIYKYERWSMTHQKTLKMQNEPNLNIFLISSAAAFDLTCLKAAL